MDECLKPILSLLSPRLEDAYHDSRTDSLLTEVVMDLGRNPEFRFLDGGRRVAYDLPVTNEEIQRVVREVGDFGSDDRAGLAGTIHRISRIVDRKGVVVGLTIRVGRIVETDVRLFADVVDSGESVLIVGAPGVGKSSMLRSIVKYLAMDNRVMVVDTSNELGGDGVVPHPALGDARRMMVPDRDRQYETMCLAVANHNPEVLAVDEILTQREAESCCTVAERGVQLLATIHGRGLESVVRNKKVNDVLGRVLDATVSDQTMKENGGAKIVLSRRNDPAFTKVIEIEGPDRIGVYHDCVEAVDGILAGRYVRPEMRWMQSGKLMKIEGMLCDDQPKVGKAMDRAGL